METENPLLPLHGLLLSIFYKQHFTDMIVQSTAFITPVVKHWLQEETAQRAMHPHKESICRPVVGLP